MSRVKEMEDQLESLIFWLKNEDDPEIRAELSVQIAEKIRQIEFAEINIFNND